MSKCGRGLCGPCYALKPQALAALVESYDRDLASPYATEEDYEMSARLVRAFRPVAKRWMMKVPYSFLGLSPEYHDAKCGMYIWQQETPAWHSMIARQWEAICLGYDPPPPADAITTERTTQHGSVSIATTASGWALWHRARVARCRVMRTMIALADNDNPVP